MKHTPPLWKQLLGAVVGSVCALTLYYAYDLGKPAVQAYLTLPEPEGGRQYSLGDTHIADRSLEDAERKRVIARNIQRAETIEGKTHDPSMMYAADDVTRDVNREEPDRTPPPRTIPFTDEQEEVMNSSEEASASGTLATVEPNNTDVSEWEQLQQDISESDAHMEDTEGFNAPDLPDTGFGMISIVAGAAAGAAGVRTRKRSV